MTSTRLPTFFYYLFTIALIVAFLPLGGVLDASAGQEDCCPPEDTCCPETEADDCESPEEEDCCSSDCSVCLLTCCSVSASMLASPVTLDGQAEIEGTPSVTPSDVASPDAKGIYHPPRS